ncbi:MAG: aldo/keto reductase, partial [Gammaproteobacteria bacterium]|nr:aldo/keto reductase [Gammaproteobacteria bacterium]
MTISRRDALKAGAGAAVALGAGAKATSLLAQSGPLIKKAIPSSGELITPIGIGTNRYGVGESDEERAPLRDTMARFVELGGQVMDTAAVYGTSEQVIGDLQTELGIRDQLFLVTKTDIRGQIQGEEGLQMGFDKLRTDVIDGYLVHNFANTTSELAVMRDWQAEGKIRYIGASTSSDNQHADMINLLNTEEVQLIQINYSLGDREAAER